MERYFEYHSESNREWELITSSVVYAEFLSVTVRDILYVRDMVKEEFLDNYRFDLSLNEIEQCLYGYPKIQGNRARRMFAVTGMLNMEFKGFESIETRGVIRFLDTAARELSFDDFFNVKIGNHEIKIEMDSPCYLKEIDCLTEYPLQENCNLKKGDECRYGINVADADKNIHFDKCLVADSPITKCQNTRKSCNIAKFFNKSDIKKNLELLKITVDKNRFSSNFRNKPKSKKWLECFKDWDFTKNEFNFKGSKCWRPFFDMIILLQCPDDTRILSSDPDFDEYGKAIGREDIRVPF